MDFGDGNQTQTRLVGDYILGPRIGSGSFAVVWRARHRHSGIEVAVKEIDKKQLSPKVSDNLLKEISILSTINHPNIIRLLEAIQTVDRIFLVLEYCDGGDLAAYIHRHGKVSEAVARNFMRQLAAGLQVLQEKNLIHRDLKPQNLLLSSNEGTPLLKIGDFGFARSLTPQGLADTLCGSPLYMAPEIIQNQKYDAKADLWSVGAILFQLMTGKPPFEGNNQFQLFQNVLKSTELRFPPGALEEIHPECVDLCRRLLRQNPVERLTFKEFFSHKFLREPRPAVDVEQSSLSPRMKPTVGQLNSSTSDKSPHFHSRHSMNMSGRDTKLSSSTLHDNIILPRIHCGSTSRTKTSDERDRLRKPGDADSCSSEHAKVADSMESIEKEYVLVNAHFASLEHFSYYLGASLQDNSAIRIPVTESQNSNQDTEVDMQSKELAASPVCGPESTQISESDTMVRSSTSTVLREIQGLSILHPSTKLELLHQYVLALKELAQEKYNAGQFLESFSVELVSLAIWKKALQVCGTWQASNTSGELPESSSANESTCTEEAATMSSEAKETIDFSSLSSVSVWAEQGFIAAFDHADRLSNHLKDLDGAVEMPDAMEIIYQKALTIGRSGAVDEYMGNKASAAASYAKAMLLLLFIVREATLLSLNPPFSLTPDNKNRIENYIINLQSHQTHFLASDFSPKQSKGSRAK